MNDLKDLRDHIGHESIAISSVKITPVSFKPSDESYIHECGPVVLTKSDEAIVEIETEEGIKGIGPASISEIEKNLDQFIGRNPFELVFEGLPPSIDVACWDLIGRARELPVCALLCLGGTPNFYPHVYASGGVMWTYYDRGDGSSFGVDALIEEALTYKAQGFDTFKWRPGTDWEEAGVNAKKLGDICRQLDRTVGPGLKYGLEKKGYDSWTFEECLEIAPVIGDLGFHFFEQPMGDEGPQQFEDYRKLKREMPGVMLWGGESFGSYEQAEPWMREGIYDAVQSDCARIGITENWRIAQLASETKTKMVPHNWYSSLGTMCNTHFLAAAPTGYMCEFFMYPSDFRYGLFKEPYRPVNSKINLSNNPGFGMELIEDYAKIFPHIPGDNTMANPRFPHAWDRARNRELKVVRRNKR
ncbi:MAG: enolase C-terminal domain-like protein [Candidatus Latescibacterota bacterium]|nr:enolase C-terminal domain-like protein [Candidatus Latescibacterota bacterium]